MAIDAYLEHGLLNFVFPGAKFRRTRSGLDTGTLTVQTESRDSYIPGQYLSDLAGLMIESVDSEEDRPGLWVHSIEATGILGSKAERRLFTKPQPTSRGFDSGTEVWLTNNINKLVVNSSRMHGYPNMVCIDVDPDPLEESGWYRVTGRFSGILAPKAVAREISVNGQSVTRDQVTINTEGGWTVPQKGVFFTPNVVVNFEYQTLTVPVRYLPMQGDAPPGELFPVLELPVNESDGNTYHWPNGWHCISFNPSPIPGTTITNTKESWAFQQKVGP